MGSAEAGSATTERVEVLGCAVDVVTMEGAISRAEDAILTRETCQHVAINAAKLVKYQHDETLRAALDGCELATADGQAVVWAARLLGRPLPERVAGIDLMEGLLGAATIKGLPRVPPWRAHGRRRPSPARDRIPLPRHRHRGVASRVLQPRRKRMTVVELVGASAPDILFVAFETPAKELFLARNRSRLAIPFVMGVGGAFDVLAGERKRAPRLLQRLGLEWLFRLAQDPRRLARRYVVGNAKFVWLVLLEFARTRIRRGSPPSAARM